MKRRVRIAAAALLIVGLFGEAQAAFLDNGWGARPIGLGGAYTAVSDDASGSLYNPAGLVQVQWNEVSAMYARLFSGLTLYSGSDQVRLDQSYLAYVSRPIPKIGTLGVSWADFTATHLYKEDTVTLSWARELGDVLPAVDNQLSIGVNFKYLRRSVTLDERTVGDPVFAGGNDSASAMTADVGLLYKPQGNELEGLRVGLSAKNLTQPDVGFKEKDTVPLEWRLGLTYQHPQAPWLVPSLDLARRDGETNVFGGAESWLFGNTLGLRAGGNRDEAAMGASYYQSVGKSFGFRLDYGFTVPFSVEGTSGSHRFQATMYF